MTHYNNSKSVSITLSLFMLLLQYVKSESGRFVGVVCDVAVGQVLCVIINSVFLYTLLI